MHSTSLLIAIVGLCSYLPLAMGASSTNAVGMSATNSTPASTTGKVNSTSVKSDTQDSSNTGATLKDSSNEASKETEATPDVSGGAGGASPKTVPGVMTDGKCMCPAPAGPTDKDEKAPPADDGSSTPTKSDPSKTPGTTPTTSPPEDKNTTSTATTMSEHAAFFTGLVSVAVASLVV
ncbi:hypothetical protein PCANC_19069 [Puccinia coronata f. sp. avenae]|uniref:Uncharacterized protein n=1 Tax=Puccinia coronata f. sp. avenae TaxID=200324 RepID=A0A2N5V1R2_9BASI|nr:hypothetical protein PCANC_19271 [Puccinia coronata f. sp. avenae]PLW35600.1 hypothetical protein PCANC_19069 [Puccinia coronata f. sp. avenae]PLW43941.1 hypothetical protein PCASD_06473 [Puccinia coronata f. sp. avenae]